MRGPNLTAMAWRNLWRHRRRTLLTLSSIAFGTMLAWLFTGLGDANWRQMIDLAARMGGGHVTLQHAEYLEQSTLSRSVSGKSSYFHARPPRRFAPPRLSFRAAICACDFRG